MLERREHVLSVQHKLPPLGRLQVVQHTVWRRGVSVLRNTVLTVHASHQQLRPVLERREHVLSVQRQLLPLGRRQVVQHTVWRRGVSILRNTVLEVLRRYQQLRPVLERREHVLSVQRKLPPLGRLQVVQHTVWRRGVSVLRNTVLTVHASHQQLRPVLERREHVLSVQRQLLPLGRRQVVQHTVWRRGVSILRNTVLEVLRRYQQLRPVLERREHVLSVQRKLPPLGRRQVVQHTVWRRRVSILRNTVLTVRASHQQLRPVRERREHVLSVQHKLSPLGRLQAMSLHMPAGAVQHLRSLLALPQYLWHVHKRNRVPDVRGDRHHP